MVLDNKDPSEAVYTELTNMCGGRVHLCVSIFLVTTVLFVSQTAAAKNPAAIVNKLDNDGDGQVSREEWRKSSEAFERIDADGDGQLSIQEFKDFFAGSQGRRAAKAPSSPASQAVRQSSQSIAPQGMEGWQGPIIDVHSQVDEDTDLSSIVPMLNQAGVHAGASLLAINACDGNVDAES